MNTARKGLVFFLFSASLLLPMQALAAESDLESTETTDQIEHVLDPTDGHSDDMIDVQDQDDSSELSDAEKTAESSEMSSDETVDHDSLDEAVETKDSEPEATRGPSPSSDSNPTDGGTQTPADADKEESSDKKDEESGWVVEGGHTFYVDPSTGERLSGGIFEVGGERYYFRPAGSPWGPEGSMGYGWLSVGGADYFFDRETGAMASGCWVEDGGHRFRMRNDGTLVYGGVRLVAGEKYYLRPAGSPWGPKGSVGYGWLSSGGHDYFFDRGTGAMLRGGIREADGESYYFRPEGSEWGPEGSLGYGWVRGYGEPAADYFFDRSTGRMARGAAAVDGARYFFDRGTGAMRAGCWVEDRGQTYRARGDGRLYEGGIYSIGGVSYYFRPAGSPWGPAGSVGYGWVRGFKGNDYFFDRGTGAMFKGDGIREVEGELYYFRPAGSPWGPEGSLGKGWAKDSDGKDRFFDRSSGKMYRNGTFIIDDVAYKADAKGNLTKLPYKYPDMLSKAQGYSSSTSYLILIDCADNRICVYRGSYGNWTPVKESRCSTGAPATYTPSGIYRSGAQGYSFSGDGHTCYYYTQIYGDVLIHSILYHEGTFNVMDGRLGYHISGGCVRCPLDFAKWVYDNVPYYTTIVVYR